MKRHLKTTGIICAILLIVLSVIFFTVQREITPVFVTGYIFLVISIAAQLLPAILCDNKPDLEFLYASEFIICLIYFVLQLIISIIALLSESMSVTAVLICESVLTGIFAIVMLVMRVSVRHINQGESSSAYNFMEKAQREIKLLMLQTTDDTLKNDFAQLMNDMSWGRTNPESLQTEEGIMSVLQKMKDTISNNKLLESQQLMTELKTLVQKRNILCG